MKKRKAKFIRNYSSLYEEAPDREDMYDFYTPHLFEIICSAFVLLALGLTFL